MGLVDQALQGLAYAWKRGIIHRDIKPANLMLTQEGTLKVADFGLAKAVFAGTMTQTGAGMGTPYYMSPEQAYNAKGVDLRSDIYSLGATFYHLVTGHVPFDGSSPVVRSGPRPWWPMGRFTSARARATSGSWPLERTSRSSARSAWKIP